MYVFMSVSYIKIISGMQVSDNEDEYGHAEAAVANSGRPLRATIASSSGRTSSSSSTPLPRGPPPHADLGRIEDLEGLDDDLSSGESESDDDGVFVDMDKISEVLDFTALEQRIEDDVEVFINADLQSLVSDKY